MKRTSLCTYNYGWSHEINAVNPKLIEAEAVILFWPRRAYRILIKIPNHKADASHVRAFLAASGVNLRFTCTHQQVSESFVFCVKHFSWARSWRQDKLRQTVKRTWTSKNVTPFLHIIHLSLAFSFRFFHSTKAKLKPHQRNESIAATTSMLQINCLRK